VNRRTDIVDIRGLAAEPTASSAGQADPAAPMRGRPWLAVHWRCCHTYSRVYRNADATAYTGRCPACGKLIRVKIGADGTSARFFEAL
jgi:hypothetical protein